MFRKCEKDIFFTQTFRGRTLGGFSGPRPPGSLKGAPKKKGKEEGKEKKRERKGKRKERKRKQSLRKVNMTRRAPFRQCRIQPPLIVCRNRAPNRVHKSCEFISNIIFSPLLRGHIQTPPIPTGSVSPYFGRTSNKKILDPPPPFRRKQGLQGAKWTGVTFFNFAPGPQN